MKKNSFFSQKCRKIEFVELLNDDFKKIGRYRSQMKNTILFICIYFLIYLNFIPNQMSVFSKNEDLVDWFHKYKKFNISITEGFRQKVKYYLYNT